MNLLDSRFRGNDKIGEITTFYETLRYRFYKKSGFLLEFIPVKIGAGMTTVGKLVKKGDLNE